MEIVFRKTATKPLTMISLDSEKIPGKLYHYPKNGYLDSWRRLGYP
jgi:hypothetical protein